ncbi:MAG TPA: alcohol dehydrogenase catalytic domain-containing protein [Candidatus Nitrosopolaris sp.]|nr:alcohol dehydrogenase catalytic domain-containing protein [Candidatus Nitrosopolaris sp.]
MQAAFCRGAGNVVLDDVERPTPGAGEVVVRVRNCGICGSDLHWYHDQMMIPSVCPGHEISGEVADVGPGVTNLQAGDAVALEGIASCGRCRYCSTGEYQRCPRVLVVGMTIPGGFAEYVKMPARHCFRVPAGVDFATAALSEPLGVAVHGVRLAGLEIGQQVAVLGAGTIGLMAVVAARAGGAGEVIVVARRPQQKAAALALGADRVVDDGDPNGLGGVVDAPIDLVVETVGGAADTLDTAVAACRPGGTICILGAFTRSPTFPALFVLAKELRLIGSFVYGRAGARADFDIVLDILRRQGRHIAETVITHRVPLAEIARGFRTAADKTTGAIKVTIEA